MYKIIFVPVFLSYFITADAVALDKTILLNSTIEHQIRLCDNHKNILDKLNISQNPDKKRDIIYVETRDRFYKENNWTIRVRLKADKVDIDLKKRVSNESILSKDGLECELDKHGPLLQKTCKLHNEISSQKFRSIINGNDSWIFILSKAQKKWLEEESALREDAVFYGILEATKYELDTALTDKISLDIVHLRSNSFYTYHEISTRYTINDATKKSALFEKYIKDIGLITCPDQIEWEINKFDVMSELNRM